MPSVGMRRTTRIFGARVLRSGRRLWTGPDKEIKHIRAAVVDREEDWIEQLLDNSVRDVVQGQCKDIENGWHGYVGLSQETADEMEIDENREPKLVNGREVCLGGDANDIGDDKRWGAVYLRKRKRTNSKISDFFLDSEKKSCDPRYGKKFFRKQTRKKSKEGVLPETCDLKSYNGQHVSRVSFSCLGLVAFVEPSCISRYWFSFFLNVILGYMRNSRVILPRLFAFLCSEPIVHVYSSRGIHFLQDSIYAGSSGFCKISGSRGFVPFVSLDFSAIPVCFIYWHLSLLLKFASISYAIVIHPAGTELGDNRIIEEEEQLKFITCEKEPSLGKAVVAGNNRIIDEEERPISISCEKDPSLSKAVVAGNANSGKRKVATVSVPKVANRASHLRNGVITRSIQKRRSSLRSRRRRNSSGFGTRKTNVALVTDLVSNKDGVPFFPIKSNPELMTSVRRSSAANIKELRSTVVELTQDIGSVSCNANILVVEPNKCYREGGAVITLERSASKQWLLVIKRNGIRRFMLQAKRVMRPCSCNRVTHDIIWTSDDGLKLEFPNRQDWFVFKELYRKCSELNVQAPTVSIIPVPGVHEVFGYADEETIPFRLPESYITVKGDEVARALDKNNPIYDMDSDDEDWLKKFNESSAENEPDKIFSEDTFEIIISAFERGFYCNPDDYSDVKVAIDHCLCLASREVLEAVHSYWMTKRKKKRSPLVRIFQRHKPTRAEQLTFNPVLRKKRSFKRQASQSGKGKGKQLTFLKAMANEQNGGQLSFNAVLRKKRSFKRRACKPGRGKQLTFLKAIVDEQNEIEEAENAMNKVQEAEAAARKSEVVAIESRQRAQLLMEIADLAAYKATMALRIAEAVAQADEPLDISAAAPFLLGE